MINFSSISEGSLPGKLLRGGLKLIPNAVVVRIMQGHLKGKKWIKGSGVNGYWLGTYELAQQKIFQKYMKEGNVVFDIGAHVGFYTLLANQLVGKKGKVFSFEPNPRNIIFFKKHMELNRCDTVTLFQKAVTEKSGRAAFDGSSGSATGFVVGVKDNASGQKERIIKIETVAIDDLVFNKVIPSPDFIKIDVEGSEMAVLRGAKRTLQEFSPRVFISSDQDARDFLILLGYTLNAIGGDHNESFAIKNNVRK